MTQGERIKELRKSLGLTLEKFGERLGVGKTAISKIERGENGLTDQMRTSICREFLVNESWLLDGTGEMMRDMNDEDAAHIASRIASDDFAREMITEYLKLDEEYQELLLNFVKKLAGRAEDQAK